MRVPRVVIAGAMPESVLDAGDAAFHHIVRVLRRGPGDPLIVLDGFGGAFQAEVQSVDAAAARLAVRVGRALAPAQARERPKVTVGLGIPRGDGFETALRWGSEMGIGAVVPLLTKRTVVKISSGERGETARKLVRWRKIARESAEQCLRPLPLEVESPETLADFLSRPPSGESRWIAIPGGTDLASSGLPEALSRSAEKQGAGSVLILVGPEGGFSPAEVERAAAAGFRTVGFPVSILRAPTAVAYLAALASVADWLGEQ